MLQSEPAVRTQDSQIGVQILANPNYAIDGVVELLSKHSDLFDIHCQAPESEIPLISESTIDVLMIHENVTTGSLDEYIENLTATYPALPILLFGHTEDEEYLYRMVCAGVRGYMTGSMNSDDLVRALEEVSQGGTWISRRVMQQFITTSANMYDAVKQQYNANVQTLAAKLTKRETEILGKVLEGLRTKEIADQVNLSHQGVKVHLGKLFRKFEVSNRSQLILSAISQVSPVDCLFDLVCDTLEDHHTTRTTRQALN